MKKMILLLFLIIGIVNANSVSKRYLNYANKLVNYEFDLNNFESIHAPFEPITKIVNGKKTTASKTLVKTIRTKLLSVFDNKAYFLINVYLGDQLIKSYDKWATVGSKIGNCKIKKITMDTAVLKCKDKVLVKTLNKKIPGIKEKQ